MNMARPMVSPATSFSRPDILVEGLSAVARGYAQVLFTSRVDVGLLLMAATLVRPDIGLIGLAGMVVTNLAFLGLGFERQSVSSGALGYNALLLFLGLGAHLQCTPAFWVVCAAAVGLVVVMHAAVTASLAWHLRLPALSLPFVLAGWVLFAAVPHLRGLAVQTPQAAATGQLDGLLRSLGAVFFVPEPAAGGLVLLALLVSSRISAVHAILGALVALMAERWVLAVPPGSFASTLAFNSVFAAVALGGVFYVPGPASALLAVLGALVAAVMSMAMVSLLAPVGLPPLAAPFNLVVMLTLYGLAQRARYGALRPADLSGASPEEILAWYRTRIRRFHVGLPVGIKLPFHGTWTCTQGNDGAWTHQGLWRHGLDFEVVDEDGRPTSGKGTLSEHHCYRLPLVSPALGTVVKVIDGMPESEPGELQTQEPWGNLVVVQHAPALFSMVAHLVPGSVAVKAGDVVGAGQLLGLCGSSGRAPTPHVHFQLQATPIPGDPTVAIELHGVVVEDARGARLVSRHLPGEGERVRNPVVDRGMAVALAFASGGRWTLRRTAGGACTVETLHSEVDLLGRRCLVSGRGARLWFDSAGDAFYAYDVEGPADSGLRELYAALLRVPFDDAPVLTWEDSLDARRLGPTWWTLVTDALAAFMPLPDTSLRFRMHREGAARMVRGTADAAGSLRTLAEIIPGWGVRRVVVDRGSVHVEVMLDHDDGAGT